MHGADKGLQLVGDTRLVALVLAAVAPQVDAVMISANRNIDTYAALAPTRQDRCTGFAGPMAGIEVALDMAADRWLATVPVDCPTPPADLVARLCDALRQNPLARCAAVFDGERVQPLFALYREGLGDAARRALRDNTGPQPMAKRDWPRAGRFQRLPGRLSQSQQPGRAG